MTKKILLSTLGVILVILSFVQLESAQKDINIFPKKINNIPATIFTPQSNNSGIPPVVFIAHGFAGSQNIMSSFALTISHAGFSVVTWDFNGHGSNGTPISLDDRSNSLLENANTIFSLASENGIIERDNFAILGHSMGSGVALEFGQENPDTKATIAVSPVTQSVSPELPKNLLLMAGSLETNFVQNAEELLEQAGGEGGDISRGNARKLQIIPNVEHISILFSNQAHQEALSWIEATLGEQPDSREYSDNRLVWYVTGIIGFILISTNLPIKRDNQDPDPDIINRPLQTKILFLLLSVVGGTLILWLVGSIGLEIQYIFNVLIGGSVILWFGFCGAISILLFKIKLRIPGLRSILYGVVGFSLLWIGVGFLGRYVWLEWFLIPKRLMFWPIGVVLTLPWFLSWGYIIKKSNSLELIGWWLVHSLIVILGLFLTIQLIPGMGFLILILPVVPILLGLHMLISVSWGRGWSFGISGAMFISWTLIAVFPLV